MISNRSVVGRISEANQWMPFEHEADGQWCSLTVAEISRIVDELLIRGANVDCLDGLGFTALSSISERFYCGCYQTDELIVEVRRLCLKLLQSGANPKHGETLGLITAAQEFPDLAGPFMEARAMRLATIEATAPPNSVRL